MSTGATDGSNSARAECRSTASTASWGVAPDDERAHGKDERNPVQALWDNTLHWERIVRELAS